MSNGHRQYGNYDSRANRIAGGILIIIISLLAFLSLVNALGGVGRMIYSFLIGVFGFVSYAYAVCGIFLGVMITVGRRVTLPLNKALKYFVLFGLGVMVFQVYFSRGYFTLSADTVATYGAYLKAVYHGETAAGWIGALFAWPVMKVMTPAYGMIFYIVLFALVSVMSFYPLLARLPYRTKKTKIKANRGKSPVLTDISAEGRQEQIIPQTVGNSLFVGNLKEGESSPEFKTTKRKHGTGFSLLFPNQDTAGVTEDSVKEPVFDSSADRKKRAKEKLYGIKKSNSQNDAEESGKVKFGTSLEAGKEADIKPSLKPTGDPFVFNPKLRGETGERQQSLRDKFDLPQTEEEKSKDLQERYGYILGTPPTANDIRGAATHKLAEPKREIINNKTDAKPSSDNKADIKEELPYFIREILNSDLKSTKKKDSKKEDSAPSAESSKSEENVKSSLVDKPSEIITSINHTVSPQPKAEEKKPDPDEKGSLFNIFGMSTPKKKETAKPAEHISPVQPEIKKQDVEPRLTGDGYDFGYTPAEKTGVHRSTAKQPAQKKSATRFEEINNEIETDAVMPTDDEIKTTMMSPSSESKPRQPYAPADNSADKKDDNSYTNDFPLGKSQSIRGRGIHAKKSSEQISIDQAIVAQRQKVPYMAPPIELLKKEKEAIVAEDFSEKIQVLETVLSDFKIDAKVIGVTQGPTFSRFELEMPPGISVTTLPKYADDIAMKLRVKGGVRFETPIPGQDAFGVEIANTVKTPVGLRGIIESPEFNSSKSMLTFGLGRDIGNDNIVCDLETMPHMLIAGGTGSGKSVCINALIISLLYRCSPSDLKLILIDPKMVEMTPYNGLPHLLVPEAIDDVQAAVNALDWAIGEMNKRYKLFKGRFRNISEYNAYAKVTDGVNTIPRIIIIFDELADFMAKMKRQVEDKINSLARLARAAGIHLVVSTQRPSVDVITGTIKSNLPSRIALSLKTAGDSMTILGSGGAEKLLGYGDMLYYPTTRNVPLRLQGAYVSGEEVRAVVDYIKSHNEAYFDPEAQNNIFRKPEEEEDKEVNTVASYAHTAVGKNGETQQFIDALYMCVKEKKASISRIQRKFSVGYGTAANIVELMEEKGYVSPNKGGNSQRDVLLSMEQYYEIYGQREDTTEFDLPEDID